jgi:maleylacetoacetate isomerase
MKLRLYSYFRSSSAHRVRIGLNIKGLDHELVPVHLLKNEQNSDAHKSRNPTGQIPTLEVDGKFLNQSLAILLFIDELNESHRLFPKKSFERAKVIEICELINSGIQPLQNLSVLNTLHDRFDISDDQKIEWAKLWNERGLANLEKLLESTHGKFSFGNELSAADCFIHPQMISAQRFKVDISKFKILCALDETYKKIPAFIKAHPDSQPDSPKDPK